MIDFFYKSAGLVSIHTDKWSFHLFPAPSHWKGWGWSVEEYDMCLDYFGLGPFALFVKIP
jgi:hypothetical protein